MKRFLPKLLRGSPTRRKPARQKQLNFSTLETRRLLAATDIRFATYNVLNFDNASSSRQDEMEIVFAELDADVIVLQEVNTVGGANMLLSALNANGQQYARSTFFDGPDTDQLLFYRTSKVSLVAENYISTSLRSIGEYTLSVADTLFNVYNAHLKASSGDSNEQQRLAEATLLRDHLETLPSDREFLVAGDMNFYTSSEPGYQKFTQSESNNDGRLEDLLPSSQIGNWHSNSSFAAVHTQSPRTASFGGGANGGLDDRFDIIFSSFGLNNDLGLEYVEGSQFVPGNDGQHFNQSILSGTNNSASAAVLQALHDASDHLPVVADFEVFSPIGVTITETGGGTSVSEDGDTDSYQLVLDSVPTSNVVIEVIPDSQLDIGNGFGASRNFTFTPGNALTAQTVNVSTIDDSDVEGAQSRIISHSATSSDTDYDGLAIDSVTVSIADNDGSSSSSVLFNEIYVNTPGTDSNREYVEILADPLSTLSDVWLLEIEGDSSGAGVIDNAQNLSSLSTGANGLLLLGDGYSTSTPWGSEISTETTLANLDGGTMENGTITFLLVEGFTGALEDDLDTNDDGTLDSTPWTSIFDGVGWTDGDSSDRIYSAAALDQSGGAPDAATRIFGNQSPSTGSSWFNGDITGTVTYSDGSSNLPANAVITPGRYNFGATAPVLDEIEVNTGDNQRSAVDQLQLTFDGLVSFDTDAFSVIQRTDGLGSTTNTPVTTSFSTDSFGGDTIVTILFESSTRNDVGVLVDGNYQLTVDGSKVRRTGTDLTLGSNIVYGDAADEAFYTLYGDSDGNRTTNVFDLLGFRQTYLASTGDAEFNANFDFDASGTVNVFDLLRFRQNYLATLPFA